MENIFGANLVIKIAEIKHPHRQREQGAVSGLKRHLICYDGALSGSAATGRRAGPSTQRIVQSSLGQSRESADNAGRHTGLEISVTVIPLNDRY